MLKSSCFDFFENIENIVLSQKEILHQSNGFNKISSFLVVPTNETSIILIIVVISRYDIRRLKKANKPASRVYRELMRNDIVVSFNFIKVKIIMI